MIFKGILIGGSPDIVFQAGELNGFIREYLNSGGEIGHTIVFYSDRKEKKRVLDLVATASLIFVRVTRYQPENILAALEAVEKGAKTHLYIFPSGKAGSGIAVRWAYRKGGSSLTQVEQIEHSPTQLVASKKVYANHVLGSFKLQKKPHCISLAKGCTDSRTPAIRTMPTITEHDLTDLYEDQFIKHSKWIPAETSKNLQKATFLVIGGRAMGSKENTGRMEKMARELNADFGVSRPVAMSAWAPMHRMIGVSGALTKPQVCIAAGVSGAAAFYAGIERSKMIIAINTDIRAPIIKASDIVIIDDYQAVMAALVKIVRNQNCGST